MPRSRINGNFIDKTFSIVANILLRVIPTTSGEKEALTYYRDGAIWFFFFLFHIYSFLSVLRGEKHVIRENFWKKKSTLFEGEVWKSNNSFCRVSSINATSDAMFQFSILVLSERLRLEVLYYGSILLY